MKRVAMLGVGRMGLPMTEHLLNKGGYSVTAWNRTADKLKAISDPHKRLTIAKSPLEAIRSSHVVISGLFSANQFHEILDTLKPEDYKEKVFMSISTMGPDDSISLNDKVIKFGGKYMETPVLGNSDVARKAALQVMVGSPKELYDEFVPLFSMWGTPRYIGPVGTAAKTKLALNYILGSALGAFMSSFAYLDANSVDTDMFVNIVAAGPFNTSFPYYTTWKKKIQDKKYDDVAFSLEGIHKDMGLILKDAKKSIDTTQIEGTYNLYDKALKRNEKLKEKDFSIVYENIIKSKL